MKPFVFVVGSLLVATSPTLSLGAAETVDPSGTWRWEYEMAGEQRKASLVLDSSRKETKQDGASQKVVGKFVSDDGTKLDISDGKIVGDQLSLTVKLDLEGTMIDLRFAGKINQDKLEGTVTANANGETYEFPWTPVRSVKADDVIGTWTFEIETPDGNTLRPTLAVSETEDGDLKAVYTSQLAGELKVDKFDLRDNQIRLNVSTEYEGQPVKVGYKGRPYGNTMTGTLEYDFAGNTGEGEFKATRKPAKK